MTSLHDKVPREIAGRDTQQRFGMQHQAAAFAALAILESGEVDRVYCDYHDDFVVRRNSDSGSRYHFHQVKTKGKSNSQWTLQEIFALRKSGQKDDKESLKKIQDSIAGRLLLHAVTFGAECQEVTLLTNVHFRDDVIDAVEELRCGSPVSKWMCFLIERLGDIFDVELGKEAAIDIGRKLSLSPNAKYIGDQQANFAVEAREAIFTYSEIDLSHDEAAEIAAGLVALVQKKSVASLSGLSPEELESAVGVGLSDLLSILSISPRSYAALVDGADPQALRTASFLQRRLSAAGATDSMIEFASIKKVDWDIWIRRFRHVYSEMDLNFLFQTVTEIRRKWLRSGGEFDALDEAIADAMSKPIVERFPSLTAELLFGGVMADWTRKEST